MRSNFERKIAEALDYHGIKYLYEEDEFQYYKSVRRGQCNACGSTDVDQERWYLADFTFPGTRIVLEAKGRLVATDRTKMKLVKEAHPELDIRMLFYRDAKLPLKRTPTHLTWAESVGIQAAVKELPEEWIRELLKLQQR